MTKKEIEIIVTPDGEVRVTVKGVKGKSCVDFTKWLEEGLGDVAERKLTSEFYERETEQRIRETL